MTRLALLLLLLALTGSPAAAQCDATTPVRRVLVSITHLPPRAYQGTLTVRATRPARYEDVATWTPESRWSFPLRSPVPVSALALEPVMAGYLFQQAEPARTELREGECVGHVAFQRAWRVRITSLPAALRVEGQVRMPGDTLLIHDTTDFETAVLPWTGELTLQILGADAQRFPLTVRAADLARRREVKHDRGSIARAVCESRPSGGCNPFTVQLLGNRLGLPREVRIRMVEP